MKTYIATLYKTKCGTKCSSKNECRTTEKAEAQARCRHRTEVLQRNSSTNYNSLYCGPVRTIPSTDWKCMKCGLKGTTHHVNGY